MVFGWNSNRRHCLTYMQYGAPRVVKTKPYSNVFQWLIKKRQSKYMETKFILMFPYIHIKIKDQLDYV